MLRSIIRFFVPLVVLAATLAGGWFLLNILTRADEVSRVAAHNSGTIHASNAASQPTTRPTSPYCWLGRYDPANTIATRIPVPRGYQRVEVEPDSGFAYWLRNLPLRPDGTPVRLFNGQPKANQNAHIAVVDIDVGNKDLQQCADAIVRLRAEYLYYRAARLMADSPTAASNWLAKIHFNFTSGDNVDFLRWGLGQRPSVQGNAVTWTKPPRRTPSDYSYANFRSYLDTIFTYAGTASLAKELAPGGALKNMRIGDVFIVGGSPGHAVMVVDMIENPRNGAKAFLLAQSFMPAQDIHILKNLRGADAGIAPWYDVRFGGNLVTPEFTFSTRDFKRWPLR